MEPGESAAVADQLLRGPVFDDASVVHHQHPVGGLHGGEPVGDDQRGPPAAGGCARLRAAVARAPQKSRQAPWTRRSDGMSSEEVASSRISTAGRARNARAKEISWRCPAETRPPRLLTSVS